MPHLTRALSAVKDIRICSFYHTHTLLLLLLLLLLIYKKKKEACLKQDTDGELYLKNTCTHACAHTHTHTHTIYK